MSQTVLRAEFLVEPFHEGHPGPHVQRAIEALTDAGISVEVGAFASTATGVVDQLADALRDLIVNAVDAGATRIQLQLSVSQ